MAKTRTLRVGNINYHVTRLYSSGVGAQYALRYKDASGSEKNELISEETVRKTPAQAPLFEACSDAFDDRWTLHKPANQ